MTTKITREQVAALQKEIAAALAPVLKKHGLTMRKNNGRYSEYDVKVSLEMGLDNPEAEAESARAKFKWMFQDYGVDFGTEVFDTRGKKYTVVGFNRVGKMRAKLLEDGKVYHADPKFFRLNGVPLKSQMEKDIEARATKPQEAK